MEECKSKEDYMKDEGELIASKQLIRKNMMLSVK
jgi:hypothetical protein